MLGHNTDRLFTDYGVKWLMENEYVRAMGWDGL